MVGRRLLNVGFSIWLRGIHKSMYVQCSSDDTYRWAFEMRCACLFHCLRLRTSDMSDKLSGRLCMFSVIQCSAVFYREIYCTLHSAPKNIVLKGQQRDWFIAFWCVTLIHPLRGSYPVGSGQSEGLCRGNSKFDSVACLLAFISISNSVFY